MRLSSYAHKFDLGEVVALYHSLRMKPVYLDKISYRNLQCWLENGSDKIPLNLEKEIDELVKFKILNNCKEDDEKVLEFVKSKIPKPAINVCYMITSEQCNLACKYCFLGNNNPQKRSKFSSKNMSKDTADKAIDFFIRQIKTRQELRETAEGVFFEVP